MTSIPVTLDPGATLPTRKTIGSAGYDLTSNVTEVIHVGDTSLIRTGVHLAIPAGHHADVRGRSGLAVQGHITHNGLIDSDYRGEIAVIIHNFGGSPLMIDNGDRIAQIVFPTLTDVELVQVDALDNTERGTGGFGSTGRA